MPNPANASELAGAVVTSVAAAQTGVTTAMTNLNTIVNGITFSEYTGISIPAAGTYPTITDSDVTIQAALDAFDADIAAIVMGSITPLSALPDGTTPAWTDGYWANLKTLLTVFTENITDADDVDTVITKLTSETDKLQVALYSADLGRKQQALRDAMSAINSLTAKKGFSYPNSMTSAMQTDVIQKYMFDLSQVSKDLIKLIFEWAKSNYQFSVGQRVAAHAADVEFNLRYADTLIKSFSEQASVVIAKYKAEIEVIGNQVAHVIKKYALRMEIEKSRVEAATASDKYNLAAFIKASDESVAAFKMQTEQLTAQAVAKVNAAATAVTAAANMAAAANQTAIGVLTV